jgi:hypothetical protein
MNLTRLTASLLASTSVAALAACTWSVPADPGENARLRAGLPAWTVPATNPATPAAGDARAYPRPAPDDGAKAIYLARCSACHEPFAPTHVSAGEWPTYVAKYGPRAGLFGQERARVLAWLQAASR